MTAKLIHKVIANAAKGIAQTAHEELCRADDAFYRLWPDNDYYVRRNWKHYIPFARQALTTVLTKDFAFEIALGTYTPQGVEMMKAEIYEALIIDGSYKAPPPLPEFDRFARIQ